MTSKCILVTFAAFFSLASGLVLSPTSGPRAVGTARPPAPRGLLVAIVREEWFLDKFGWRDPKPTAKQEDFAAWLWAALPGAVVGVVSSTVAGLSLLIAAHFADTEDASLRAEMRLVNTRLGDYSRDLKDVKSELSAEIEGVKTEVKEARRDIATLTERTSWLEKSLDGKTR